MITPVISGLLRYQLLSENYLSQTIECMATIWAYESKERSISEYFPLARKVCEAALTRCLSIILVNMACDKVIGFDINLDLMELLEVASELEGAKFGATSQERSEFCADSISLGRYDFLAEIHEFYTKHQKLMLRKGEALFHNYVGLLPSYQREGTWHICLALALEIAKSNKFRNVITVTNSSIADQKVCEQLGFRKIGDLEYTTSKSVPIQKDLSTRSVVYLYDLKKAKL